MESYAEHAWPRAFARLFDRNGTVVSLLAALVTALLMLGVKAWHTPEVLYGVHTGPGAFYRVISHEVMVLLWRPVLRLRRTGMAVGAWRYWRATGGFWRREGGSSAAGTCRA